MRPFDRIVLGLIAGVLVAAFLRTEDVRERVGLVVVLVMLPAALRWARE